MQFAKKGVMIMAGNRIPRTATKMNVEFLIETSSHSKTMSAEKTDNGWVGVSESGNKYYLPIGMLRNSEVCKLTNII